MSKELVISATSHERRVAILEEGQLVEIYIEREKEFALVGSIYKGRVTRVLPGMQSAFVDIGLDGDAFLYVSDVFENLEDYDHGHGHEPAPAAAPASNGGATHVVEPLPGETIGRSHESFERTRFERSRRRTRQRCRRRPAKFTLTSKKPNPALPAYEDTQLRRRESSPIRTNRLRRISRPRYNPTQYRPSPSYVARADVAVIAAEAIAVAIAATVRNLADAAAGAASDAGQWWWPRHGGRGAVAAVSVRAVAIFLHPSTLRPMLRRAKIAARSRQRSWWTGGYSNRGGLRKSRTAP